MKLLKLISTFVLSLPLLCSSVNVRHGKENLDQHTVLSQRQIRPDRVLKRDLIDICVNLDVLIDGDELLEGLFADVHLCLCLKDLDLFLDSFIYLQYLGLLSLVQAQLNEKFHSQPACDPLPAYAHRACTTEDPCAYACNSGFTKVNGQCVCASTVCNGVCGNFPHGCGGHPSSVPRSLKKRVAQDPTFADAQASCGSKRVCGLPDGSKGFECVDITTSESCGGCVYAHPWSLKFSQTTLSVKGQDCTALTLSSPQVLSHRCEMRRCVVDTCVDGYIAGPDGCFSSSSSSSGKDVVVSPPPLTKANGNFGPDSNAAVYGLVRDLVFVHPGKIVNSKRS